MDRRRRWKAITLGATAMLVLGAVAPAAAQTPKEVTESLCGLFTRRQVRDAVEQRVGSNDEQPGMCFWGADRGDYGGELVLQMAWEPVAFDDQALVAPDATDLTVGGRPARFWTREGDVIAVGEGQVKRDIYSNLVLDLEQGPLGLHLTDTKGGDRQQTLQGLGELAVAKADRLVAPPRLDATLAALVPATIGGQTALTSRVLFPSQELCSRCDSGKSLRAALKTAGKTFTDVSMLTASGVDPARADQPDYRQPAIRALKVAGTDASAFVEPVITYLTEGIGVEAGRIEGDGVIAITRPEDEYNFAWTSVVYPQADTVWVVTADDPVRSEVLAALPGAPTAPPLPTPAPTATPDVATAEGWFRSVLPATLGGERLRIASVSSGDALMFTPDALKQFRSIVKDQGKQMDDLSSVTAMTASGAVLQGYRIAGGQGEPLVEVFVDQLRQAGALGRRERPADAVVGGKTVGYVESPAGTLYLYPGGEVLWLAQLSSPETAAELFAALP